MYINVLPRVSDLKITLFVDDAALTYTDKNPVKLQNKINYELQKIENRMKINKLTINYNKINYMIKKIDKSHFNIKIGQKKICNNTILNNNNNNMHSIFYRVTYQKEI